MNNKTYKSAFAISGSLDSVKAALDASIVLDNISGQKILTKEERYDLNAMSNRLLEISREICRRNDND